MPDKGRPVYTIGTAAELLGVHPRTLRLYEGFGNLGVAQPCAFVKLEDCNEVGLNQFFKHFFQFLRC